MALSDPEKLVDVVLQPFLDLISMEGETDILTQEEMKRMKEEVMPQMREDMAKARAVLDAYITAEANRIYAVTA